jgi:hypothetical protein
VIQTATRSPTDRTEAGVERRRGRGGRRQRHKLPAAVVCVALLCPTRWLAYLPSDPAHGNTHWWSTHEIERPIATGGDSNALPPRLSGAAL